MTRDIGRYEAAYTADYGFEAAMVSYRRRLLLERLAKHRPRTVLEIGCGAELLYREFLAVGGRVDQWTIVEPAAQFADAALQAAQRLPNLSVIGGFFEDVADSLLDALGAAPEFVICSSLLHEVPDADRLLQAITAVIDGRTLVHVNVPNATSFHRRLARSMGLLQDLKQMSERNVQLQQYRVFDLASLRMSANRAGLQVIEDGGYLVKPFTHAQMELVRDHLGPSVLDGLFQLGKEAPEWASEVFVEARRAAP